MIEPLFPEVNHSLNFMLDYIPAAYSEDRTAGANPVKQQLENMRDAGLMYGNIIYDKSPVILEMLVKKMGKEPFRKGIREYLKTYAYGNATWEGLIGILDTYTDDDLSAWSHVWVNEKGMPEISCEAGKKLYVEQSDPLGRGLLWEQDLSFLIVHPDGETEEVQATFAKDERLKFVDLKRQAGEGSFVIPNADGKGYGFFRLLEKDTKACLAYLPVCKDEVLRGSLLITLYENLLNRTISSESYMEAMLDYLPCCSR